MVFKKYVLKMLVLKKIQQKTTNREMFPSMQSYQSTQSVIDQHVNEGSLLHLVIDLMEIIDIPAHEEFNP